MVEEESRDGGRGQENADTCPICLETISGEAFLDQCFHRFCFHCVLQWSEMLIAKPQSTSSRLQCLKCPLCKSHFTSIIHDLSGAKFDRHFILTPEGARYHRQDGHLQRQAVYASDVEQKLSRFTNVVPKPNRWLSVWVKRELQAIMQEEDVDTVMQHVVGVVEGFYKRGGAKAKMKTKGGTKTEGLDWHATISTAVQPFIFEHAEKFAEELGSFLLSGLDIVAYDQQNLLRASVAGQLSLLKDANPQEFLKGNSRKKTFDLYDEDVDDDGVEVMVGRSIEPESHASLLSEQLEQTRDSPIMVRRSPEAEHPFRGETSENMEHQNHDENSRSQSHTHAQREIARKHEEKPISPSQPRDEGSHDDRRHHREVRRNRKRGRPSPSTPS